jgi:hypothetical protein
MMSNSEILNDAGFEETYQFIPREFWVNRDSRMSFNFEGMRDADSRWLAQQVQKSVAPGCFVFYCGYGAEMDHQLGQAMLEQMGLGQLKAEIRYVVPAQ